MHKLKQATARREFDRAMFRSEAIDQIVALLRECDWHEEFFDELVERAEAEFLELVDRR